MEIVELRSRDEYRTVLPVMHELRPGLEEDAYLGLLDEMCRQGYRLFALRDGASIVSLAGGIVLTNLYYGRHFWLNDLVTVASARSRGYASTLLAWLEKHARVEGCGSVAFTSRVERAGAHHFYEEHMGYARPGYVFRKVLPSRDDSEQSEGQDERPYSRHADADVRRLHRNQGTPAPSCTQPDTRGEDAVTLVRP